MAVVEVSATVVAAAAYLWSEYGDDISGALSSWLGLNDCAGYRKSQYRAKVNALSLDELAQVAQGLNPRGWGWTGNCRKYTIAYAGKRLVERLAEEGLDIRSVASAAQQTSAGESAESIRNGYRNAIAQMPFTVSQQEVRTQVNRWRNLDVARGRRDVWSPDFVQEMNALITDPRRPDRPDLYDGSDPAMGGGAATAPAAAPSMGGGLAALALVLGVGYMVRRRPRRRGR